MTSDEYRTVTDFEDNLKLGDKVWVHWRFNMAGVGKVDKINPKSLNVKLTESAYGRPNGMPEYPVGSIIRVARITAIAKWGANNRVVPVGGYK